MTRKRKCQSESNSFVAAAEQVCLQPVLEHRQRRGLRNIAGQVCLAMTHHPRIMTRLIHFFIMSIFCLCFMCKCMYCMN